MNNNRRRSFRPRPQRNNFRRRNSSMNSNGGNNFNSNGNMNFNRNGSMTNPHNVEKTVQKFQQLAKDAQSSGDPVLVENYLQHADHYLRRFNELNERKENSIEKSKSSDESLVLEDKLTKDQAEKKILVLKKDLFNIRFKKVNNQINNPAQYNETKKSIARLYTQIKNSK